MTREKIMISLFEFSAPTYYKWSKQDKRKIFDLLDYAFTNSELEEFIKTGKINKIEDKGSLGYLFSLSMKFYKACRYMTNSKVARNLLLLLEKTYKDNRNSVVIEKIAEEIYKNSSELFEITDNKSLENTISMKLALLNLIQKQELLVLEYICKNRKNIEQGLLRNSSRTIKKMDILIPNMS